jgi:hypothetical protein
MLFDFEAFIQGLMTIPDKSEVIERYEKNVEDLSGKTDFKHLMVYKEYVQKTELFPYAIPEELALDFDWQLLLQLVQASFSSTADIRWNTEQELPDLLITVNSKDENNREVTLTKTVSELWSFQVLRLFEIYCEECMNLQSLSAEEGEAESINAERKKLIGQSRQLKLKFLKLKALNSLKVQPDK